MIFAGYIFCITGTMAMARMDFEKLLKSHGATIKTSVTYEVTHLICSDTTTKKATKAKDNGVAILSEADVMALLNSGGGNNDSKKRAAADSSNNNENKKPRVNSNDNVVDLTDDGDCTGKPKAMASASNPAAEWKALFQTGFNNLADGETAKAKGSKGNFYTLKNVGGVYSCSCPGWKNQKKKIGARTCKHLKEYRGEKAETKRINAAEGGGAATSTTTASKPKSTTASSTKSTSAAAKKSSNSNKATATPDGGLMAGKDVMLAKKWESNKHNACDYLMSEKLDGVRALWNGKTFVSRNSNAMNAPAFFVEGLPTNMALDGELFAGRGKFDEAVGVAKRHDGGEAWRGLTFVVFDAPTISGGFERRLEAAAEAVAGVAFAKIHPHIACRGQEHLAQELERINGLNGEGVMMRKKNSAYGFGGKRNNDLLKVKTFEDAEAIVIGFEDGKGRLSGKMGNLICRWENDIEFKVGSGFKDDERTDPNSWLGKVITVQYQELTAAGKPRFPTFKGIRTDVDTSVFGWREVI